MGSPRSRAAIRFIGALLALTPGCYLAHERAASEAADAHVRDATDAHAIDVGPPDTPLPDSGAPDPEDLPPDLPAPSNPTPPSDDEPALVPVGEPTSLITDPDDQGGAPWVVWNGTGWGLTWSWRPIRLHLLDADGVPLRPATILRPSGYSASLDFAEDRYAVVALRESTLFLAGADGTPLASTSLPAAVGADVARIERSHVWTVISSHDIEGDEHRVDVLAIGDEPRPMPPALELEPSEYVHDVRIAAIKTRAVATWTTPNGASAQVVGGAPLVALSARLPALPAGTQLLETEAYRERVLIGGLDGAHALVTSINPWTTEVQGPFVVGATGITDRRVGIAAVPEHGFYVVCFERGMGPAGGSDEHDGVSLQVIGDDGSRWGAPLALVSDIRNIGGVDCGWNGHELVVIWWSAALDPNEMWSQRVRATFL